MKTLLLVISMIMQLKNSEQQLSIASNRGELKLVNFRHLHRHRLDVLPQATLEVDREIACVSTCLKKHDCFSMNTRRNENGKYLCQFLNTSMNRLPEEKLTQDDAFVHWYLQDACIPSPCKNNGNCIPSSSGGKQVSCECVDGHSGNVCQIPIDLTSRQRPVSLHVLDGRSREVRLHFLDSTHNYALGKPTSQSTTHIWGPEKAVDGNRNFNIKGNSCTHTDRGATQWWRVDLEQTISVAYVVITNRGDCCGDGLGNFEINIGDSLVDVNPKCGDKHSVGEGLTVVITCSPPLSGRYVLVQSLLGITFNICELEVYAKP